MPTSIDVARGVDKYSINYPENKMDNDTEELERQLQLMNAKMTVLIDLIKGLDYKAWVFMRANNFLDENGSPVEQKKGSKK
jgi:hypothetical protein